MENRTQEYLKGEIVIDYTWPSLDEIRSLPDEQLERFSDWADAHWCHHLAQNQAKREKDPKFEFNFTEEISKPKRVREGGEPGKDDTAEGMRLRKQFLTEYPQEMFNQAFQNLISRYAADRPTWRYKFIPTRDATGVEILAQPSDFAKFSREVRLRKVGINIAKLT